MIEKAMYESMSQHMLIDNNTDILVMQLAGAIKARKRRTFLILRGRQKT